MEKLIDVVLKIGAVITGLMALIAFPLNLYLVICVVPTLGSYYYSQKIFRRLLKQSKPFQNISPFLVMSIVAALVVFLINMIDDNLMLYDSWKIILPFSWIIIAWLSLKDKTLPLRIMVTLFLLFSINTIYFGYFGLFMLYF